MIKKSNFFFLICLIIISCGNKQHQTIRDNESLQKAVLQGWNTWNNPNVLSHVKMPDGLALQLVFRKKKGGPYYLRESYISSPKVNFPEKIIPKSHAYDGSYTELDLEWEGLKATIQSARDGNDVVILYTPKKVPPKPPVLILETGILWNKKGTLQRDGHRIIAGFDHQKYVIRATCEPTDVKFPFVTPYLTFKSNEQVGFYTGRERSIAEIKSILNKQLATYKQQSEKYGNLIDAYQAMQSVIAWNIIYDAQKDRALVPVSRIWNEAWGGYIIFDWDTYFTAFMLALDQKDLAYSNAIAMTDAVTEKGFVPNLEASFGVKTFDRSQPPVGSIVCNLIYKKYQEKWFLREVYENLLSWNRWWESARDNQGYLSWGTFPHPREIDPPNKQAAKFESGLDNSPLFDDAIFNEQTYKLELASVGLMSLYIADCRHLIEIAQALGRDEDIDEIRTRAEKYTKKLNELWDEKSGIYRDKDLTTGKLSSHLAPTNFYPLIAKVPTQQQAQRMIDEHFFNPDEFYGEWMIPSISRDDPGFGDNSYWRGRIWAPMNFLVYLGLRNYDLDKARKELAEKSLNLLLKEWLENQRVYENYNAETGVGGDVRNSDSFYSWGGLLGMIALMEAGYW